MKQLIFPTDHIEADFFKGLTEALPQLIWSADPDGRTHFVNQRCLEYTGHNPSMDAIEHWMKALHPDDAEEAVQKWNHSIQTKEIFQHEYRLKRFDGIYHWFLGRAVPIYDHTGEIGYWLGTATDIEAHKILMDEFKVSRDELNIILESVTEGITVLGHSERYLYANQVGARMCGFESAEELIAADPKDVMARFELFNEDGSPVQVRNLPGRRALRGEKSIPDQIIRVQDKITGESRWSIVSASPVFNKSNEVIFAVSIFRDFTKHKRSEDELRGREREFRLLAETIPHMAWTARPDGLCDWFNQRWVKFTGLDLKTNDSMSWTEALEEEDRIKADKAWRECLKSGWPFELEYKIKSKVTNQMRWHLVRVLPAVDEKGKLFRWFGTCTDIHEAKLAEENVRRAEENSRFLAEAGIILGSSLSITSTIYKLIELITPRISDWCRVDLIEPVDGLPKCLVHNRDPERVKWAHDIIAKMPLDFTRRKGIPNVIRTGIPELYTDITAEQIEGVSAGEETLSHIKDLGLRSAMIVPIIGKQRIFGALTLVSANPSRKYSLLDLTVAEDIGRRTGVAIGKALLYESEKRARKEAEDANKAKSTFLANMSHEMRTPLNALIGFNELLKERELSDEERDSYHDIIARNGDLLLRLIDDILDLSKVEAGHLTLEYIPISLPDLLSEVTSVLSAKARKKGLKFLVELDSSVPETIVTDPVRLKQVLNNIVGNAIKFTSEGSVRLEVSCLRQEKMIEFRVTDTGPGIRTEYRKNLFQPFSQADPSVTRKFGGTGLGLVLSRKLAQSLGGGLTIEDYKEGEGAQFLIQVSANLLPLERSKALLPEMEERQTPESELKGKRILLVEDSPDNQLLVECVLKSKGLQVETAENGQLGVEKALSQEYDLVLMDVQMPVMDGYTAMKTLSERHYSKPIIALTAHAMKEDRQRCIDSGCVDFLTKPIKPSKLVETISRHL